MNSVFWTCSTSCRNCLCQSEWENKVFMIKAVMMMLLVLMPVSASFAGTSLEKGVLDELNLARTKPAVYADILREHRKLYKGRSICFPGQSVRIVTNEGVSAVDEAIRFLDRQKPQPPLQFSEGLAEAAAELAEDQGQGSATGHTGRKSGSMIQRIERHGEWKAEIGENISYGYHDPRLVVIQLIVDDGIRSRGHRTNIFKPAFRRVGIACGPHAGYRFMCVMDFAGGFSR
jgi:uncharacterized protein YkwD